MANAKISDNAAFVPTTDITAVDGLAGYTGAGNVKISGNDLVTSLEVNLDLNNFTTGILNMNHGGTGLDTSDYTNGDMLYFDTFNGELQTVPIGAANEVLTVDPITAFPTWVAPTSASTNSYMLTGMIDNIASNTTDFTTFGGRLITSFGQGSGFQVFQDSELTHISFKYLSDDVLIAGVVGGYEVKVYESNAGFEDLPADDLSNYTLKGTPITITSTGGTPNDTDFGVYPYANIALGSPITLTAGKFYAIVGARVNTGLFDTDEEAQITLRITE